MPKDSKRIASAAMPADAARLRGTRRLAAAAMLFEQGWPALFGLATVVAAFFAFSWFGLFAMLPGVLRIAVLAAFAAAILATLWRARGVRLPSPTAIDQRIETRSHLAHQPLQAQGDRPTSNDPVAGALWREHQRRMALQLRRLNSGAPQTRTERLDPYGLRTLVALLLVTAFAFSYGPAGGRMADAFAAPGAPPLLAARVDAWVTPPAYTGRAPVFLTDAAATEAPSAAIEVPEGSMLSVRVSDCSDSRLTFTPEDGGAAQEIALGGPMESDPKAEDDAAPEAAGLPDGKPASAAAADRPKAGEYDVPLAASGAVQLASTFRTLGSWSFTVIPDTPPTIAFANEPTATRKGALEIGFTVSDDYGVRKGTVGIEVRGASAAGARPLVPVPEISLALPRRTKGDAKGRTSSDLTDSPYAGAEVGMTLEATDDAGQTGRSETKTVILPQRPFANPLAKAVVEQRRILALDANAVPRVVEMLDAVTLRGEDFIEDASTYLALRAVRSRVANAEDDATLVSALDFMWQIALGIEDGKLSLAERKLRDAKENLADAIEKGASDAEIDKLMAELREAMQQYMQAMAEAMKNQPPMSQQQMQNTQVIRPSDIEKMMDRIENLAKSGSKDAAQQLLSELQQMMDQMQAAQQPGQQQGGEQNAMRQQMDKLGEVLRKQQELKDKTYELGRQQMQQQMQEQMGEGLNDQPQPGEQRQQGADGKPMTAEELKQALKALKEQQGQLQKDLQAMQDGMKGMGMEPGESLGEAGKAMGKAEGALGEGDDGEAVGQQGQAMEALRRGAKDMMQKMQQAMQQGQGQQPGQQGQMGEGLGPGQQRSDRDPLGRPRSTQGPDFGQDVRVPDEIDTQRARKILDAIRDRLGDALSPQLEREYLERLLKPQ